MNSIDSSPHGRRHDVGAARAAHVEACAQAARERTLGSSLRTEAMLKHIAYIASGCTVLQQAALQCNRLHYNATCGTIKDAQLIVVAVGDHNQLSAARTDLFDVALDLHSQATSVERIESMVHLLRCLSHAGRCMPHVEAPTTVVTFR